MRGTFHVGDALATLRGMPDRRFHCCITSPPYWGLRDYGTATWTGGDAACDHKRLSYSPDRETPGGRGGSMPMSETPYRDVCGKCGAFRVDAQLGLEPTPEEYVAKMVEVFREVRRVLRDDGTCWVNLGDSYARMQENNVPQSINRECVPPAGTGRAKNAGLKPKDMVGIPWRVAFALQADGWYLRSDIIWAKPNPMPESVTDRPTKSHEYLFLLSKSERYYYDAEAIKEESAGVSGGASFGKQNHDATGTGAQSRTFDRPDYSTRNRRTVWTIPTESFTGWHESRRWVPVERHALSGGMKHIASQDCPSHGGLSGSASTVSCGEHEADLLSRTEHTSTHPLPELSGDCVGTPSTPSDCSLVESSGLRGRSHSASAIDHNIQTHRTAHAPATTPPYTPSAQTASRTGNTSEGPASSEPCLGRQESNISADDSPGSQSTQNQAHIESNGRLLGLSEALEISRNGGCRCSFYQLITTKTSHFATYPRKLVEPCIKAGTSERGCCADCGMPWRRMVDRTPMVLERSNRTHELGRTRASGTMVEAPTSKTIGWRPACACGCDPVPCRVLDPFNGSGTTGAVACILGRDYEGIELNPEYAAMAERRIKAALNPSTARTDKEGEDGLFTPHAATP